MLSSSVSSRGSANQAPAIVWFRDDLRLADQPALAQATASGRPLICVWIHDPHASGERPEGGAARWWRHASLRSLEAALAARGGRLLLLQGDEAATLDALVTETGAQAVYWNRRYGAAQREVDRALKASLRERGVSVESFSAQLLNEPWTVLNQSGEPFRVFSAYWRACLRMGDPPPPEGEPERMIFQSLPARLTQRASKLDALDLAPRAPDWSGGLREAWPAGEEAALERLRAFLATDLDAYAGERDEPGDAATSRLSPYLAVGAISPRQVWAALRAAPHTHAHGRGSARRAASAEKFASELGWREFCHYQRFHYADLATRSLRPAFDAMPWRKDTAGLRAWQRGLTGYPLVDAGMRELWHTGWMHNRVRMVAASFLSKHLLIDWRAGESWFWDTLVDADPASNPANWQWVAGSGVDAAPYFRIFNPVLQGQKFDPRGAYVRHWVPELAGLPDALVHQPWKASAQQLEAAAVRLGKNYPEPVVEHELARQRALEAYAQTGRARGLTVSRQGSKQDAKQGGKA
ncbi:deoxyribodipyrimidine photo-lyase [Paraburkholderia sp. CNPSo 3281]|uniref:cryptochrome/photolyase family protein n=1 Tax=Paraburkholderia sp. CNPSo 3281 TaxID=2940933 RepID=UPI0020B738B9|nr:deoxyribodipyrimidine photo-lyase [Paraburkholderia sp. CNPSo 3281]MCP3719614.1 DNA photolyase family protein [Paraburkholderia sp. CNPSo 3281]